MIKTSKIHAPLHQSQFKMEGEGVLSENLYLCIECLFSEVSYAKSVTAFVEICVLKEWVIDNQGQRTPPICYIQMPLMS